MNCLGTPTFCTSCDPASTSLYLSITNNGSTQTCLIDCGATNYPDSTSSVTTCTPCINNCATCTTITLCLTCNSGFFYSSTICISACPSGTTIANNATNNCDPCDPICLTCAGTVTDCTACSSPNVFYNGSCLTACPSGGTLAPLNGICTACDATCLYCSIVITNCTACNISSTTPYLVGTACLTACPAQFYN